MSMAKSVVMSVMALLVLGMGNTAAMAKEEGQQISKAAGVLKGIGTVKKKGIPPALISDARGIAIFPGASKKAFMVSGGKAGGVLLVQNEKGKWSNPVFVSLGDGTIGWQIVGEQMDIILVFKSSESIDAVKEGKLQLKSRKVVISGPVGDTMKGATDEELKAEVNSYIRSGGEFKEISLVGSVLKTEAAANDAFYGKKEVRVEDILSGKTGKTSAEAKNLQMQLSEYAAKK